MIIRKSQIRTEKSNLKGGKGTIYTNSKEDGDYAHIDGGTSNPGYFSCKHNSSI